MIYEARVNGRVITKEDMVRISIGNTEYCKYLNAVIKKINEQKECFDGNIKEY